MIVYHALTSEEMSDGNLNREDRASCNIERFKQKLRESEIAVTSEDRVGFDEYARRWMELVH